MKELMIGVAIAALLFWALVTWAGMPPTVDACQHVTIFPPFGGPMQYQIQCTH